MTSEEQIPDLPEEYYDRRNPRRTCSPVKSSEDEETNSEEDEIDSTEPDNSSDEDFSLTRPRKKRPKKKKKEKPEKEKREKKVKKNRIPTYDEVLGIQIRHAQQFVNYDDSESEVSSTNDEQSIEEPPDEHEQERERESSPIPEPPKKKRVIIYPWNPIGITSGRLPVTDVSKLET